MMYEFMKDARYKDIVKKYVDAMEKKQKQQNNEIKDERILEDASNALNEIAIEYEEFYNKRLNEVEKGMETIERSYKETGKQYDNPQAEILRRQDFEAELAVASDSELEDIAKDTNRELSKYEFNKLLLEFKERDLQSHDLLSKKHNNKKVHEEDPKYQQLKTEYVEMMYYKPKRQAKDNWLPFPNLEEDGRPQLKSMAELLKPKTEAGLLEELKQAYMKLESHARSASVYRSRLNPVLENEMEQYADKLVETGEYKNRKQYADDDLRAIEGSSEYDVTDKFKYLKERYHDPSNAIYSIDNPNYSVHDHYEYLKKQHEKDLQAKPELKKQIEQVLSDDRAKQEEKEASKPQEVEQVAE